MRKHRTRRNLLNWIGVRREARVDALGRRTNPRRKRARRNPTATPIAGMSPAALAIAAVMWLVPSPINRRGA